MEIVIVGASLAGLRTAESLRNAGFDGRITLVGDETHPPYDRPPLSKGVLTGKVAPAALPLRDEPGLLELGVELLLGLSATGVDLAARAVELGGRSWLPFDELVIASGARARRLPEFDAIAGAHVLRTLEDAVAIRDGMERASSVAVVGGGFIGSEVASASRDLGLPTTVLEATDAPMSRVLGPTIGDRLGRLHREHGSVLRC